MSILGPERVMDYQTVQEILDGEIAYWQDQLEGARLTHHRRRTFAAQCYLDAYQRMRERLLGSKPIEGTLGA